MKRILISNAGGTIAQSIARVLRQKEFVDKLEIFALAPSGDFVPPAVFDRVIRQPGSYSEIEGADMMWLASLVSELKIDLVLPTTDYEAAAWAAQSGSIPAVVASAEATSCFYDKWKTFLHFQTHQIPFAQSQLPSLFDDSEKSFVAKPRTGGLSVGLLRSPSFVKSLPDSEYVVQEFLPPPEYTIAFYVTRMGGLIGPLILERQLRYGMTIACRTCELHIDEATTLCRRLCQSIRISGPCNLQCRYTDSKLVPFEVNCRFSGTCGLRSDLGFSDISFAVNEYLFDQELKDPGRIQGSGIRRIADEVFQGPAMAQVQF